MKSLLALPILALAALAGAQTPPKLVGKTLPKFAMKGTDGKAITSASLRGKVVLIDLWATWCGPCKLASPTIQKIHDKYAKRGVVVIGANTDASAPEVKAYMKEHGYTYKFATGAQGFLDSTGAPGIPFFVVLDKKGKVIGQELGFTPGLTGTRLSKAIDKGLRS